MKFIAIWEEYGDTGGVWENTAEVDCNDTPKEIYNAFKEYGLSDYDFENATFYKVSEEFYLSDILVGSKQS